MSKRNKVKLGNELKLSNLEVPKMEKEFFVFDYDAINDYDSYKAQETACMEYILSENAKGNYMVCIYYKGSNTESVERANRNADDIHRRLEQFKKDNKEKLEGVNTFQAHLVNGNIEVVTLDKDGNETVKEAKDYEPNKEN